MIDVPFEATIVRGTPTRILQRSTQSTVTWNEQEEEKKKININEKIVREVEYKNIMRSIRMRATNDATYLQRVRLGWQYPDLDNNQDRMNHLVDLNNTLGYSCQDR